MGDGGRERGVPLPVGQELAGVPAGEWTGRGAPLLGLSGVVTEAEMEALFGGQVVQVGWKRGRASWVGTAFSSGVQTHQRRVRKFRPCPVDEAA